MDTIENKNDGRIEILGQILWLPRTIWGTISLASIIAGICTIVYIVAVHANPEVVKEIASTFVIGRASTGKTEVTVGRYQIQFWTPSVQTKYSKDCGSWEKVETDSRLDEFAARLLTDRRVRGYRRYEVTGQGIGHRRQGYWWVLTVDDDYTPAVFAKVYEDFWKNKGAIYIEILHSGSRGKYISSTL